MMSINGDKSFEISSFNALEMYKAMMSWGKDSSNFGKGSNFKGYDVNKWWEKSRDKYD